MDSVTAHAAPSGKWPFAALHELALTCSCQNLMAKTLLCQSPVLTVLAQDMSQDDVRFDWPVQHLAHKLEFETF